LRPAGVWAVVIPVLWLTVLGSAAGAVYSKHRARELFVELERLNRERDRLEIEWGQLQLEQSTVAAHVRVEKLARDRLGMKVPAPGQIVAIDGAAK
jgi:cell division protein FtsL